MKKLFTPYLSATIAMILFGMSFVWTEGLLTDQHFPPQSLVCCRLLIGGVALLLFLLLTKRFQWPAKKDIKWFLLLALFEPFIYFLGETNGLRLTQSPSLGAVVLTTAPLFCMIACAIFFKERPSTACVLGMLLTLPGVVLVMLTPDLQLNVPLTGTLLLFVAAGATAGYAVVVRKLSAYSAITIVTIQNFIGILYFLPLVVAFEQRHFANIVWSFDVWHPLLMLSIFVTAITFVLYVSAVKQIGATQSNMFTALIPVVATLAAFFMGRENITFLQIAGVVIVILGLLLSQYKKKKG